MGICPRPVQRLRGRRDTRLLLTQIERFAPGLRERILATAVRSTTEIARDNANYVGGDIINGANTPWQTVVRPRLALDPYSTGIPGVFICSAATPPGAGAHGMNGYNAARSVLRGLAGGVAVREDHTRRADARP